MQLKASTYEQYLELFATSNHGIELTELASSTFRKFSKSTSINSRFAPVTYILDYTTRKYLFIEKTCLSILGYTAEYFLESGHETYISKWHPGEYEVLNTKIFSDNCKFLKDLPLEKYQDYIFSFNYRVLNGKGVYIRILQRYSYIPGKSTGNPAGTIGIIFDITHFKNDDSMVHTIEEAKMSNGELVNEIIFKKSHPIYDISAPNPFTRRELEIIKYLSVGLSSKEIAENMALSIHTINNHRKNMLHKMNCRNVAELLNQSKKIGAF